MLSKTQSCHNVCFTLSILEDLGLNVNFEKSILQPSQVITYIGAILDSREGRAFLPGKRQAKIARFFHPWAFVKAHCAQRLLGLMPSTTAVVQHARLKMRLLWAWFLTVQSPLQRSLGYPRGNHGASTIASLVDKSTLGYGQAFSPIASHSSGHHRPTGWGAHWQGSGSCQIVSFGEKTPHQPPGTPLAVIKAF